MKTSNAGTITNEGAGHRVERSFVDSLLQRRWFIPVLIAVALLFTGCCSSSPSDAEVTRILGVIAASSLLSKLRSKVGTEFDYFVKRRIKALLVKNSGWNDSPYIILTNRISHEINKILPYIDGKLGKPSAPGKLGGATDPDTPPHTDLKDVAKIYVDDGADAVKQRQDKYVNARRERVRRIIWRALAVHDDLWKSPSSMIDFSWHEAALDELLDRRLRFVERMIYTDDAQGDRSEDKWVITAAGGPWRDNKRTVLFEYPFQGTQPGTPFMTALAAAGLTLTDLEPTFVHTKPPEKLIRYMVGAGRIRPPASGHWFIPPFDVFQYNWNMKLAGKTPSQILDLIAPATSPVPADFEDYWQRNWIYCDHMVSLLKADALRFGLRRRTNSDTEFNNAADDGLRLAPLISTILEPKPAVLMDNGNNYFEGVLIEVKDLQIGDLVIIWNNYFFRTLMRSDFGLENSVITNIYGEESQNATLAGHGASEANYTAFVAGLVSTLDALMKHLRKEITAGIKAFDPGFTYKNTGKVVHTEKSKLELIYWAPFKTAMEHADNNQELQVPGPWWIRVRLKPLSLSVESALILFPKSVAIDTSIHKPPLKIEDADPDFRESVYIPLSMPKGVRGGWKAYFESVRKDLEKDLLPPDDTLLEDAKTDSEWAPGFNFAGPGTKIPVFRPKVRI